MIEIWRNVVGYEGLYQVSNFGRIKSLSRVDYRGHVRKERLLKPAKDKDGYLYINLYKDGTRKTCKVHRLVAETFIPNPQNLLEVNHLDENRTNNIAENLEWCTHFDNNNYGTHNERVTKAISKTVYQYTLSGEFVKEYSSTREVQRQTGWSSSFISACCLGKYGYGHGYIWSYTKHSL